jgi:hypothetical protein
MDCILRMSAIQILGIADRQHFNHYGDITSLQACCVTTSKEWKHWSARRWSTLHIFDTLDKGIQKVEAAMKSFSKKGKGKVTQEISDDEE